MTSNASSPISLGWPAARFDLPGIDGRRHTLESARGPNGLLVMFICNHCPYVRAVADKIVRDMRDLAALGIGSIAIMSNDAETYPEDSFDNMKAFAARARFRLPVRRRRVAGRRARLRRRVHARLLRLRPRSRRSPIAGRLDASGRTPDPSARARAVRSDGARSRAPAARRSIRIQSIGCSIKWRAG